MWQRNYNQHSSAKHAQQKTLLFACFLALLFSLIQVSETAGAVSLPAYNVNINRTSVSGLSAGGFMAVQMNVAFSSIMIGAGVFAGGPYNCAQGDLSKAQINCMYAVPAPSVSDSIQITNSRSKSGSIDDVSNLANQQIYIFSGTKDTTVKQAVSDVLNEYYLNYVTSGSVVYDDSLAAAHTFPTNNQIGNGCGVSASPYISYCQYDGAGYALNHIFNYTLNPRSDLLTGEMIAFDQTEFYNRDMKTAGMDDVGYLYVPKACSLGASCSLHIALHGCLQAYENVGDDFIYYAGYNEWAETNNLIILYPQSVSSLTNPSNPNACWDWWGYTNPNTYDIQSGVQMQILKSMIDRISSQYADYLDAPTLSLSNVDDTSVTLQWNDVENAFGYYVYRNDDLVTASPVEDTQYTDNGLSSGSKYVYNVAAVASTGQQGPLSSSLTVSTTGNPPPLTPPSSLTAEEVTSSTIILAWSYVSGAEKYNVYRNGNFVGSSSENGYSDGNLQASTTYTYTVNAENSSGVSDLSNSLAVTTASSFECTSHTTNNYQHVVAGRAYAKLGIAYASGSDDYMGLYNIFVYTTLSETSLEYFVVGSC